VVVLYFASKIYKFDFSLSTNSKLLDSNFVYSIYSFVDHTLFNIEKSNEFIFLSSFCDKIRRLFEKPYFNSFEVAAKAIFPYFGSGITFQLFVNIDQFEGIFILNSVFSKRVSPVAFSRVLV
jgi:hypothetical protein